MLSSMCLNHDTLRFLPRGHGMSLPRLTTFCFKVGDPTREASGILKASAALKVVLGII